MLTIEAAQAGVSRPPRDEFLMFVQDIYYEIHFELKPLGDYCSKASSMTCVTNSKFTMTDDAKIRESLKGGISIAPVYVLLANLKVM